VHRLRRHRLKYMVKLRHKPISDSEAGDSLIITSH
jgi:hypothetical protein